MVDESSAETSISQGSTHISENINAKDTENLKLLIERTFIPYEKFPEKARFVIDRIDKARVDGWQNAEKNNFKIKKESWGHQIEVESIPYLNKVIDATLDEVVRDEYPGFLNARDDDFLSLSGSEWITREMALDELDRLIRLQSEGKKVENQINAITSWNSKDLDEARSVLAKSVFLSHATRMSASVLEHGVVASREELKRITGKSYPGTSYSHLKEIDQEMEQVPFYLDTIAFRYGGLGKLEGMRGVFLFNGPQILLDDKTSFFSADGLHVFKQNGTSFGLESAVFLTTNSDYEKGIHGIVRKPKFMSNETEHVELLTEEGKERLEKLVLRDESKKPIFVPETTFEKNERLPTEIKENIEREFKSSISEETRHKVKRSAYIVPTGEFGDGPGVKSKIFKRQIIIME